MKIDLALKDRIIIFERDDYACTQCGRKSSYWTRSYGPDWISIEAHHKLPRNHPLVNEPENITTTCENCHKELKKSVFSSQDIAILERDNYMCQRCGDKDRRHLEIHHKSSKVIEKREGRDPDRPENQITYCANCHGGVTDVIYPLPPRSEVVRIFKQCKNRKGKFIQYYNIKVQKLGQKLGQNYLRCWLYRYELTSWKWGLGNRGYHHHHNSKRPPKKTIKELRKKGYTYKQIGKVCGVHWKTAKRWIREYELTKVQIPIPSKKKLLVAIRKFHVAGDLVDTTKQKVADYFNTTKGIVNTWFRRYKLRKFSFYIEHIEGQPILGNDKRYKRPRLYYNKPSQTQLLLKIKESRTRKKTAEFYGTPDQLITKWCRSYGIQGGPTAILRGDYDHLL